MTNQENVVPAPPPGDEYEAGQRSITGRRGPTRFDIVREKKRKSLKGRPYVIGGLILLIGLMIIPTVAFINTYVMPPRALAIRVGDVEYTRGDVVDLIRFNQRLSEELGIPFQLGTSVFDALQTIQQAELSYQIAPRYGITVEEAEVDERIDFILGLTADNTGQMDSQELQVSREEAKREFLNRVGLPETVWRDFIKKIMVQEKLRDYVGQSVPRIQPQVHVYQIILDSNDTQAISRIDRDLEAGIPTAQVVDTYSVDPNARRDHGDQGWVPQGMMSGYDNLLYGTKEDGSRILPFHTASPARQDSQSQQWSVLIVDEYQEAHELSDDALSALTDSAFNSFLNQERTTTFKDRLYLDLNSDIANWVNKQVQLNAIPATPGAGTQNTLPGVLPGGGTLGVQPTPMATPRGIPGITVPVN